MEINGQMCLRKGSTLQGGKYRIDDVLGQGGFGITYLGEHVALGRRVAIKEFFMKELCDRDGSTSHVTVGTAGARDTWERFKTKFLKEARTIAQLDDSHVVRIHDIFGENGTAYYVMEYIDGGSLEDYVNARGRLSAVEARDIACQIADALGYIHGRNILHLDVKPSNVLMRGGKEVVLIDFGVSKRYDESGSQTSTTPAGISKGYAPIEQYRQGGVSHFAPTTDIYSLGAVLYKMLTGDRPPEASVLIDEGLTIPSYVDNVAAAVIHKAMSPRRADRYQTMEAMSAAIRAITSSEKAVDVAGCGDVEVTVVEYGRRTKAAATPPKDSDDATLFTATQGEKAAKKPRIQPIPMGGRPASTGGKAASRRVSFPALMLRVLASVLLAVALLSIVYITIVLFNDEGVPTNNSMGVIFGDSLESLAYFAFQTVLVGGIVWGAIVWRKWCNCLAVTLLTAALLTFQCTWDGGVNLWIEMALFFALLFLLLCQVRSFSPYGFRRTLAALSWRNIRGEFVAVKRPWPVTVVLVLAFGWALFCFISDVYQFLSVCVFNDGLFVGYPPATISSYVSFYTLNFVVLPVLNLVAVAALLFHRRWGLYAFVALFVTQTFIGYPYNASSDCLPYWLDRWYITELCYIVGIAVVCLLMLIKTGGKRYWSGTVRGSGDRLSYALSSIGYASFFLVYVYCVYDLVAMIV